MLLTMSGSCISCNIMQEPTTSNIMHEVPLEAVFLHLEHSRSSSPLSLSLKKKKMLVIAYVCRFQNLLGYESFPYDSVITREFVEL